jgi:hypothetical protein
MRKTILAFALVGGLAASQAATAQTMDGGGPPDDGGYVAPPLAQNDESGGHTGSSTDKNGNMGNEGRTNPPDAGATSGEGTSTHETQPRKGPAPQGEGTPSPYTGKSTPVP